MNQIEAVQAGVAPRIEAGLRAMQEAVGDGEWHPAHELVNAALQTGLAARTAENLLKDAVLYRVVCMRLTGTGRLHRVYAKPALELW